MNTLLHRGARRRAGFTLLEIMLSISILSMLMSIAWGSFNYSARAQRQMQSTSDRLHGAEQAMNRIVRELSMAFVTPHGQEERQLEIRYKTGLYGEDDRIDFTTMGHVRMFRDDKVGDQMEISYYIKSVRNDNGEYVQSLVRRQDAPIDDNPQKGGTVMVLLEDVRDFKLEYWDDAKAELAAGGDGWVNTWDTESTDTFNRLPGRVRITLEIPHPRYDDREVTFVTQAEIHMTEALNF